MRFELQMRTWCVIVVMLGGCDEVPKPAADQGAATSPSATVQNTPEEADGRGLSATDAPPMSDALHFVPARATAVLMKDHRTLREFGLPFLLNPGSGFDGRMGDIFSEREIELSVLALLNGPDPRQQDEGNFISCLQLAPGATVQRLVNAWQLKRDDKSYPGFTCYRNVADPELSYLVVQRGATVAIGSEAVLKPRLVASAPSGPIEKQVQSLTADHELIVCCLTDFRDLSLAEGYLQPLVAVLDPWLKETQSLPMGSFNSITVALRLRDQPQVLVRVEAADASLASEMSDLFERNAERLRSDFGSLREDLKAGLPVDAATEIDQFLAGAVSRLRVRRSGQQIDVSLPLGKDGTTFKRFVGLVQREGGGPFEQALYGARRAGERRDPHEQLRQIGLAFHNYHDVHGRFPADVSLEGKALLSWRVLLLPFMDEGDLFAEFKLDEPWDSANNLALVERLPPIYRDPLTTDATRTTFQVFSGAASMFSGEPVGFSRISDGSSHTLLAVQSPPGRAVPWSKPEDLPYIADNPTLALGKVDGKGTLAVMFDGRVINIPPDYPSDSWRRLILPRDGETVELPRP